MKTIALTQGKSALVDEQDFEWLCRFTWHAAKDKSTYYAIRSRGGKTMAMHREIMQPLPPFLIDHINHNGLDNRRGNLRICSATQNAQNRRPLKGARCRYKGVWPDAAGKYKAEICVNGRRVRLGTFDSEIEAAWGYDERAEKEFGDFAYLNFPKRLHRTWVRRKILETAGKIFSLEFQKRSNNRMRSMTARLGVAKDLKNMQLPYRARKHRLLIVYDMASAGYRAVPIDRIKRLTIDGENYRIV